MRKHLERMHHRFYISLSQHPITRFNSYQSERSFLLALLIDRIPTIMPNVLRPLVYIYPLPHLRRKLGQSDRCLHLQQLLQIYLPPQWLVWLVLDSNPNLLYYLFHIIISTTRINYIFPPSASKNHAVSNQPPAPKNAPPKHSITRSINPTATSHPPHSKTTPLQHSAQPRSATTIYYSTIGPNPTTNQSFSTDIASDE